MKQRTGFVSNSSASSFILDKRYIEEGEQESIRIMVQSGEYDYGSLTEDENFMRGWTSMDNGDLYEAIKKHLNLPLKAVVQWGD